MAIANRTEPTIPMPSTGSSVAQGLTLTGGTVVNRVIGLVAAAAAIVFGVGGKAPFAASVLPPTASAKHEDEPAAKRASASELIRAAEKEAPRIPEVAYRAQAYHNVIEVQVRVGDTAAALRNLETEEAAAQRVTERDFVGLTFVAKRCGAGQPVSSAVRARKLMLSIGLDSIKPSYRTIETVGAFHA